MYAVMDHVLLRGEIFILNILIFVCKIFGCKKFAGEAIKFVMGQIYCFKFLL